MSNFSFTALTPQGVGTGVDSPQGALRLYSPQGHQQSSGQAGTHAGLPVCVERGIVDLFFDQEFRSIIPPLATEELEALTVSLLQEGNRDPIVIWKETKLLLDGHHRYDICHLHNIPLKPATELSFPDRDAAKLWIINTQLGRRNLPPYDRIALVELRTDILAKQQQAKAQQGTRTDLLSTLTKGEAPFTPINIRQEVARAARVSTGTVAKFDIIQKKGTTEQKEKLRKAEATINQVYVQIHREEVRNAIATTSSWPTGKYRVIYADPPWQYSNTMPIEFVEQADHYPLKSVSELCLYPVKDLALDSAVLFLWATSPILEEAFQVINAWGSKYKASWVWDKVKHVMCHYNSVRHEFLLLAVRGSCPPDSSKLFDSVVTEERTTHSRKPAAFRRIIDTLYPHGPRLELFFPPGREKPAGWEIYGLS